MESLHIFPQNGCLDFPEPLHIVIYTLIIYLATENSVTAAFPLRSRMASLRLCPNLRKVNIFRSQGGSTSYLEAIHQIQLHSDLFSKTHVKF